MSNAERMVELAERLKTLLDNDETVHDDGGDEVQVGIPEIAGRVWQLVGRWRRRCCCRSDWTRL